MHDSLHSNLDTRFWLDDAYQRRPITAGNAVELQQSNLIQSQQSNVVQSQQSNVIQSQQSNFVQS